MEIEKQHRVPITTENSFISHWRGEVSMSDAWLNFFTGSAVFIFIMYVIDVGFKTGFWFVFNEFVIMAMLFPVYFLLPLLILWQLKGLLHTIFNVFRFTEIKWFRYLIITIVAFVFIDFILSFIIGGFFPLTSLLVYFLVLYLNRL